MTDLCYNCFKCHLPAPCVQPLIQCDECHCYGHTWIFCPRGNLRRVREYRYHALCHNCDQWHLPEPCAMPFHVCERCGRLGHLQFFCPINAYDRVQYLRDQQLFTQPQLQTPASEPRNHVAPPPQEGLVSQDTVARIQIDAVRHALDMLAQGHVPDSVINFFEAPLLPPQQRIPFMRQQGHLPDGHFNMAPPMTAPTPATVTQMQNRTAEGNVSLAAMLEHQQIVPARANTENNVVKGNGKVAAAAKLPHQQISPANANTEHDVIEANGNVSAAVMLPQQQVNPANTNTEHDVIEANGNVSAAVMLPQQMTPASADTTVPKKRVRKDSPTTQNAMDAAVAAYQTTQTSATPEPARKTKATRKKKVYRCEICLRRHRKCTHRQPKPEGEEGSRAGSEGARVESEKPEVEVED